MCCQSPPQDCPRRAGARIQSSGSRVVQLAVGIAQWETDKSFTGIIEHGGQEAE